MYRFLFLVGLMSTVCGQNAPDNRGTEFVIAFMDNYLSTFKLELFVTTSRTTPVNVVVTSPKWTSPSVNERFTVIAGTVKQLFIDLKLRLEGTVKQSKGLLIKGDDEIVIYGVNKQKHSNDAFLGLPVDVLGTEYYTVTYYPPYRRAQICVVGVEDATTVKIKLGTCSNCGSVSYGGRSYSRGDTLTVTLNRFDAIQLQSTKDLTGTYISSNKPVSAFSGNRKTNTGSGGSQDHLVEQLIPVDTWGKRFATVPTPARTTGDFYKIVPSEDNTIVKYKCDKAGRIISNSISISRAGDNKQISVSSNYFCYFTADKPIMLTFIVKSQLSSSEPADPAMIIIPPFEQYAADYTFTTPKYSGGSYTNYFMFVVKKAEKDGLILDGKPFPSNTFFNDIPDTDFVGGYTLVSDGSHTVRHKSPISIFGGFLYGKANLETYGFTTGMRMARVNAVCIPSPTVVGDGIDNDCDGLIDEELCMPENKGKDDDGDGVAEEDCAKPPPIDGLWAAWANWAPCSVTCASGSSASGSTSRTRTCTNPAPKYDGKQCVGSSSETGTCSTTTPCPVNGNWASWTSWGTCSVSCGSGQQRRTRGCTNPAPAHGGMTCSGSGAETMSCTMPACPVDGNWGQWLSWGSCSVTCASGTQTRSRRCDSPAPANGGRSCSGSSTESMQCTKVACPIDGSWAAWGAWGSCSVTCASGIQRRSRTCSNPAPAHNGANCVGDTTSTQTCTMVACPINGNWGQWLSWGSCSVTCATGTQTRSRRCDSPAPAHGGSFCSGSANDAMQCTQVACPVDGNWANWGTWGSCSVTCASGIQRRSRTCSNPAPAHNGANCAGDTTSTQTCTMVACPIDGNWGAWASWGTCSVTCASGTQQRQRSCDSPAPAHNGAACVGSSSSTQTCTQVPCPIDGNWGAWASWGTCSVTCASGTQQRQRSCDSPAPAHNGAACVGSSSSTQTCTQVPCPIDGNWGNWASWGTCSVTCASGIQERQRPCDSPAPAHNGAACVGSSTSTQTCTQVPCPIDGNWAVWGSWGSCSVTCATGTQDRSRTCTDPAPAHNGANCAGSASSTQSCTMVPCPIDGNWGSWASWGTCSVSCGGGQQQRTRSCDNPTPMHNGAACPGTNQETQDCNTQSCIIDGSWGAWEAWGVCSVSCGGGKKMRMRVCDDPRPQNGGLPCSGVSSESNDCSTQSCPTAAPGAYVQKCPTGYFTCQSGAVSCIDESFKCDCDKDCDDGSDESVTYGSCDAALLAQCPSGAPRLSVVSMSVLFLVGMVNAVFLMMR